MANPTLAGNETPFLGFTLATIVERLLATFGLTESAATGRTIATTDESAQARVFVRRAVSMLNGKFPSVFSIRVVTGTWIAGDHSLALPTQCRSLLYFIFDGLPLWPITRDDDLRIRQANTASGVAQAPKTGDGNVLFYRTTGIVLGTTATSVPVVRLYDTPAEAKSYEMCFNTIAAELTTEANVLPMMQQFQEWVLSKARALWASELNDLAQKSAAAVELKQLEDDLIPDTEAMLEVPHRLKWRLPNPAGVHSRRSAGGRSVP